MTNTKNVNDLIITHNRNFQVLQLVILEINQPLSLNRVDRNGTEARANESESGFRRQLHVISKIFQLQPYFQASSFSRVSRGRKHRERGTSVSRPGWNDAHTYIQEIGIFTLQHFAGPSTRRSAASPRFASIRLRIFAQSDRAREVSERYFSRL